MNTVDDLAEDTEVVCVDLSELAIAERRAPPDATAQETLYVAERRAHRAAIYARLVDMRAADERRRQSTQAERDAQFVAHQEAYLAACALRSPAEMAEARADGSRQRFGAMEEVLASATPAERLQLQRAMQLLALQTAPEQRESVFSQVAAVMPLPHQTLEAARILQAGMREAMAAVAVRRRASETPMEDVRDASGE